MRPPADRAALPETAAGDPADASRRGAPPVSVVIPAYNRATTIGAAIASVLRQTWTDFELVVVDDGSTDGTAAAAGAIADPRLRVVAAPRNRGAAAARNLGVAEATGAWIAFQDSDDEWLPSKLEKQMARLAAPDAAGAGRVACYCGLLIVGALDPRPGERTRLAYNPPPETAVVEGDVLAPMLERNLVSTQTLVVRRDAFLALGGFDEDMPALEDWDFAIRLAARGSLAFVDEPLVLQRFSENSLTRHADRQLAAQTRMVEKNRALYAAHPAALARQYYALAGIARRLGRYAEARALLARARRVRPGNPRPWAMALYVTGLGLARGRGRRADDEPPSPGATG
jgi:glycosyltransferase involved in cell wall biosynthesis